MREPGVPNKRPPVESKPGYSVAEDFRRIRRKRTNGVADRAQPFPHLGRLFGEVLTQLRSGLFRIDLFR